MIKYFLSLLVFLGLMSCNSSQVSKYSKIEYYVGPCFGFCPVYTIIIDADCNAILEAEHFNFSGGNGRGDYDKPREGTFRAKISQEEFDRLITLTDAADVKNLKDSYADERLMDASQMRLKVHFADGSIKEIKIKAGEKPQALEDLLNYISELKQKQTWEKISN